MKREVILRNIILTALVSICTFISGWAQQNDSLLVKIEDGWIEKMDDKIAIDVSLNNSYEIFEVKTVDTKYILHPNTAANLRFNVNYKFISLGFQFAPDFIPGNGDEYLKGDTKSFELRTALIFKHWFTDLSYSKVKGYYLENSDDFITLLKDDPYIQFPDLNYYGFAITTGYSSNSKFSLRSLTSQTERQLRSAGSFIPSINLRYFVIDDKSSGLSTQKSNNFESSIGPGYVHTFVSREKFYFSLGLMARIGYLNTKLTTRLPDGDLTTNQDNFIFRWDGKVGLGYNGKRYYTGIYSTISGTEYRQENTTVMNFETRLFYHLFLGIRLSAPGYLERKTNRIEKLFQNQNDSN
ncbi:DUF4421 family protein [Eudoraea adriatica]|uniref:DUF4421 family protein n=1 Tax=Eudoraea adriatica TaxID=446681 RepID=UPI0003770A29|nr:DUF4421 family protein [Eudoraea adriatica]